MTLPLIVRKNRRARARRVTLCPAVDALAPARSLLVGAVVVGALRATATLEPPPAAETGDPEDLYPPMLEASRRVIARTVPAHLRDEAESVANEAIAEAIGRWRPGFDPGALAFVTVRARVIDFLRKEGGRRITGAGRSVPVSLDTSAGADAAIVQELAAHGDPAGEHADRIVVRDGLRRLNQRQRLVLYRRYFEGRRYHEIADEIGVLPSRVHEIGQEGLRKLGAHVQSPERSRRLRSVPTDARDGVPAGDLDGLLSEREQAVLQAAADGLSAEETATRFGRSVETIKAQRRAVIRKLGAANIMNAIHIAHRLGVLA